MTRTSPTPGPARALVFALALVFGTACADAPAPPPTAPAYRPDLLAGCYGLRWGGPTYGAEPWPQGWEEDFVLPERFLLAPVADLADSLDHHVRLELLEPRPVAEAPLRVDARLTPDGDSLLMALGRRTGLTFRLALVGDTLPGVAALWDRAGDYDPARYLRYVMAVRVDCVTGEPVRLRPPGDRRQP
jgi:hypothetical protein